VEIRTGGLEPREGEYRLPPMVSLVGLPPGASKRVEAEPLVASLAVWVGSRASEKP
jgi:hypothetical protein